MRGAANERAYAEARAWIGTPYLHQASHRGWGTDCLGLVRGVWRALYGEEPRVIPAYTQDWGEAGHHEHLWSAARQLLCEKPLNAVEPGDVLLFRMREAGPAKHLGLQAAIGTAPSFIHAYSGHEVTESPLSSPWARRVVARFGWPEQGGL